MKNSDHCEIVANINRVRRELRLIDHNIIEAEIRLRRCDIEDRLHWENKLWLLDLKESDLEEEVVVLLLSLEESTD